MRDGAIHDRTTFVILCSASMNDMKRNEQPALPTLYLALTPIFSGRKAKINLQTTPKLTVVIPISCLLPCSDQGIFVRGGGGGVHVNLTKKALTALFVCFLLFS